MKFHMIALLSALAIQPLRADVISNGAPPAEQSGTDAQIDLTEQQLTNLGIKLGRLKAVQELPLLYAPGSVVIPPDQDYIISSAQAGVISKLNVAIGDRVTRGQVLAVVNSPGFLALQRQYLRALSEQQLAESIYRRDEKLLAEGVISNRRFEQTRTNYVIANSNANEAAQLLQLAGMSDAALKQLASRHRLSNTLTIRSPVNAVVLEKMVVVGMGINAQSPLYHIADIDRLWLDINIPQEHIGAIGIGDLVRIMNTSVTGKISLIGHIVNAQNQTVPTRAVIANSQDQVRPGQSINTLIVKTLDRPAYQVSNEAISQRNGRSYLFIRNESGFLARPIRIVGLENGVSFIRGALTGNETIAIRGAIALKATWLGLGSGD